MTAYRRAECYLTPHLLSSFRTEDRSDSVTSLKFGASSRTRTGTPLRYQILSLRRLPISPYSHIKNLIQQCQRTVNCLTMFLTYDLLRVMSSTIFNVAPVQGVEPRLTVLETDVLP